ncbi:glycine cleavage system regulatory protein [Roseibium hamelinense]|uniref:Glycine cleavage system regulatory protein n=1 Tax=Roseibium hamelinense TaxID=150831 RepID=A0A562T0I8_9HYPH|nr:ACT domain-containing protein [Roseibium hamelinense]MTI43859.1 ACT domain-containing protein [Roseibium hamelinense]TWI87055.1 glycine cleavage system regulatory protein [Roseibium hamelinense]
MQSQLVFTVIAEDRPGLVDRLADAISQAGGNWVESSMARLGGEFAGIVSVDIAPQNIQSLHDNFDPLLADGIAITLRSDLKQPEPKTGTKAQLDLLSQDHPGLLRQITQVLAAHNVSIEHLETSVGPGSMQGEAMFKATADLRLPDGLSPAQLSEALQETAGDLMADVSLTG